MSTLEDQLSIMYAGPRLTIIFLSPLRPTSQVIHAFYCQEYYSSWQFELKIYPNILTTHYVLHHHSHLHRRYSLGGMSMYQTWRMSWRARIISGSRYWEVVEWGRLRQRSTSCIIRITCSTDHSAQIHTTRKQLRCSILSPLQLSMYTAVIGQLRDRVEFGIQSRRDSRTSFKDCQPTQCITDHHFARRHATLRH